ncbi:MAG: OsmC family protein [Anaerolineae bacterium]|nr:OsmC family protein [Anaerolineae bacterium]
MNRNLTVLARHIDGLRSVVTVGTHTVVVDPPPEEGGTGTAMSAPDLFAAALAACFVGFIANSCRLNGISLDHLEVELTAPIQTHPRRVGDVEVVIRMEPEPPEDVRQRILAVLRRATLLNTLAHPPQITFRFAQEESCTTVVVSPPT